MVMKPFPLAGAGGNPLSSQLAWLLAGGAPGVRNGVSKRESSIQWVASDFSVPKRRGY